MQPSVRTIYLLPTRACLPLAAVLLAMAYAAVSQNNAGAYLLGFFLVSLGIITMIHTHFALTGLRARLGQVPPGFAGGTVRAPLFLENGSRRARRAIFRVARAQEWRWPWQRRRPAAGVPAPAAVSTVTDTLLAGRKTLELTLELPLVRRGREPFGRLVVSTFYPLGFFRGLFFEAFPGVELLVYPAPLGLRPLPDPPADRRGVELLTANHAPDGAGDDYVGTRPYRAGDSQRHVDWRAVARGTGHGGLLVKQFAGAARAPMILDWNMLDDLSTDVETRLSQLCRWLLEAENTADLPYGLKLPGPYLLPPGRGEAHLHQGLRALALFGPDEVASAAEPARR